MFSVLAKQCSLFPFSSDRWRGLGLVRFGLYHAPSLAQHIFLVRIRERLQCLLKWHPFHRVVLRSHLRISLVCLEEEEVDCLVERFCTEPELILDLPDLSAQLHPTHSSLFSNFSHCCRDFVFVFFD